MSQDVATVGRSAVTEGGADVSEYQYYEFLAIDGPLDARAQQELRAVSSRARISSTRFVNTHEWGDLRADPQVLMASYFDASSYLTNWGTRQLMFRLPSSVLDLEMVSRYCATDTACAWAAGDSVIIALTSEKEDDDWDDRAEDSLGSIVPVRSELAVGDRRLLYLAWLLSVDAGVLDDAQLEPPVPAGLRELNDPLRAVVEFLRLDEDLLSAAAEASEPLTSIDSSARDVRRWVARLPAREKEDALVQLVSGDLDVSQGRWSVGFAQRATPAASGRALAPLPSCKTRPCRRASGASGSSLNAGRRRRPLARAARPLRASST
jgi:hypothetical protein